MSSAVIANRELDFDAEGFLQKPEQWTEDLGVEIASKAGIDLLTERHWLVIRFMRDRFLTSGQAPSIRTLGRESGVSTKELYQLFPKGPAKLAARIGGIPKPHGCI
jgi:tRNA 2-thiouridine synthesizing protein E